MRDSEINDGLYCWVNERLEVVRCCSWQLGAWVAFDVLASVPARVPAPPRRGGSYLDAGRELSGDRPQLEHVVTRALKKVTPKMTVEIPRHLLRHHKPKKIQYQVSDHLCAQQEQ